VGHTPHLTDRRAGIDEYEALETAAILSDSETLAANGAGPGELAREETVRPADLRSELAQRRSTR
jgi:hypothetical protein